jgi:predicted amidohydrolase
MATADLKPRKVVVGTSMYKMFGTRPGVEKRLGELCDIVDRMAEKAASAPKGKLDIAVLPEAAVYEAYSGTAAEKSVPLEGPVLDRMGAKAREHGTYIVVPMFLTDEAAKGRYSNAAVLVDRAGRRAGVYRKVHPVLLPDGSLEDGVTPGLDFPVFEADFGRIGLQICFDVSYDDGWAALATKSADLVAWPTQSPATVRPAALALQWRYWIVSATWRNNASLFDPTGFLFAQVREPERVMVREIDLSFAVLPWSAALRNGALMAEKYGDRVGYRYSEAEDCGLFWSNDPAVPIGDMVREAGLELIDDLWLRNRRAQDLARRAPPLA